MRLTRQFNSLLFCLRSAIQDEQAAAKVDVGWREIVQALVVTPAIVVVDKIHHTALQVAGKEILPVSPDSSSLPWRGCCRFSWYSVARTCDPTRSRSCAGSARPDWLASCLRCWY